MPRSFIRLSHLEIDKNFTKKLDTSLKVLIRESARAWLRAVITRIPIWTGFAMGSIKFAQGIEGNLGAYLRVSIPIRPISETPKWYYHNGRRIRKIPEQGGRFSNYVFSAVRHVYSFSFRDDVIYFIVNDFYGSQTPSSPWLSMEAGNAAFRQHLRLGILKIPKIKDSLIRIFPKQGL